MARLEIMLAEAAMMVEAAIVHAQARCRRLAISQRRWELRCRRMGMLWVRGRPRGLGSQLSLSSGCSCVVESEGESSLSSQQLQLGTPLPGQLLGGPSLRSIAPGQGAEELDVGDEGLAGGMLGRRLDGAWPVWWRPRGVKIEEHTAEDGARVPALEGDIGSAQHLEVAEVAKVGEEPTRRGLDVEVATLLDEPVDERSVSRLSVAPEDRQIVDDRANVLRQAQAGAQSAPPLLLWLVTKEAEMHSSHRQPNCAPTLREMFQSASGHNVSPAHTPRVSSPACCHVTAFGVTKAGPRRRSWRAIAFIVAEWM